MPPRLVIELVAVAIICVAFGLFVRHERSVGAAEVKAKIEAAVEAERERVREEEKKAARNNTTIGEHYVQAVTTPVTDAPVVRVCKPAASQKPVLRSSEQPAAVVPDAGTAVSAENSGELAFDWDTKPVIEVGRDADAQVIGLQEYIQHNCLRQ